MKRLTRDLRRGEASRGVIVSIKDVCDLYNTDMIASIAFGLRSYSLRNTQSEIGSHCQDIFKPNVRRIIDFFVIFFLPKLVPLMRSKLFTEMHSEFLRRVIQLVIEERERGGDLRNDLIEMLLTLKKEADLQQDKTHFTHHQDFLAAQAATFEVAGIETCSSTMSFALYELAKQPLMQERLRREIRHTFALAAAHGDGPGLSYELIGGMRYLEMVVEETLRKYPIVPVLERECSPINKKRFYSLRPHAECYARRGMPVFISNLAIHHDPQVRRWPCQSPLCTNHTNTMSLFSCSIVSTGRSRNASIRSASVPRINRSKRPCRICPSAPGHTTASACTLACCRLSSASSTFCASIASSSVTAPWTASVSMPSSRCSPASIASTSELLTVYSAQASIIP